MKKAGFPSLSAGQDSISRHYFTASILPRWMRTPTAVVRSSRKRNRRGPEVLYKRLQQVDPDAAQAIHPNNVKRVIRALEFAQKSGGKRISEHNRSEHLRAPAYDAVFFVFNMDREKLYERIDRRVDLMMEKGLVAEVRKLKERGLTDSDVSMQGIGYRQILGALDGNYPMEEAVRLIKRDSRHFAKRQLTWFRRERGVTWIDLDAFPDRDDLLNYMEQTIRRHFHL